MADEAFDPFGSSTPTAGALQLEQLKREILVAMPYIDYEYVDVTFGSADTDLDIRHTLRPSDPENLDYQVVRADRATTIYHDQSGARKPWATGYLILRSSAASASVRLLLFIPRLT